MQFLFSSGSIYTYSVGRAFHLAAQCGFDGIELMIDQRWDTRQPAYLRTLVEQYHLPILAVHSPLYEIPGWEEGMPQLIQRTLEVAEAVGAKVIVHHLPEKTGVAVLQVKDKRIFLPVVGWDRRKPYRDWLTNGAYRELQSQTGVKMCIENMPAKKWLGRRWSFNTWNTIEEIQRFPNLTLDTTHLGTWGLDPVEVYRQLGEKVAHVHLSNFDGREHRLPEMGDLPLEQFIQALARNKYQGFVTIELHPDACGAGGPDEEILRRLKTSLTTCRGWAKNA